MESLSPAEVWEGPSLASRWTLLCAALARPGRSVFSGWRLWLPGFPLPGSSKRGPLCVVLVLSNGKLP